MKKFITLIFFLLFGVLLVGCKKQADPVVNVLSPAGGPTLAIIQMIQACETLENIKIQYEVVADPQYLSERMIKRSHEIVIAPTNVGANLYNKGSNYLYAGALTFGNLYLVGTVNLPLTEILDKKIVAFGNNQIPGIMLTEILKEKGVYQAKNIEYQTAVNDAQFQLISGNYEFALLAEPALSATKMKLKSELNKDLFIIADLQALYQEMTGLTSYPQAGLFIEQGFYKKNKTFVEAFLDAVANSAAFVNDNHETAATYYQEAYELGTIPTNIPIPVLKNAIVGSNIGFVNAADSQESMNQYLEMIYRINPNLVGGKMVDEGFYLKK